MVIYLIFPKVADYLNIVDVYRCQSVLIRSAKIERAPVNRMPLYAMDTKVCRTVSYSDVSLDYKNHK